MHQIFCVTGKVMDNISIYTEQHPASSTRIIQNPDGVSQLSCRYSIGVIEGMYRNIPALVCDGFMNDEKWIIVSLNTGFNNLKYVESVAVLGANDEKQAEGWARQYFGIPMGAAHACAMASASAQALQMYLDNPASGEHYPIRGSALNKFENMVSLSPIKWAGDQLVTPLLAKLLHEMGTLDTEGQLLDPINATDLPILVNELGGVYSEYDALIVDYGKMDLLGQRLNAAMARESVGDIKPVNMTQTKPFKRNGVSNVAMVFELSDGQSVTIVFHNPDATPNKLAAKDTMTSWKWMLNKRDVTAAISPKEGENVQLPILAKRILTLVSKNSARFLRANAAKGGQAQELQEITDRIATKQTDLEVVLGEIKSLESQIDEVGKAPKTSAVDKDLSQVVEDVAKESDEVTTKQERADELSTTQQTDEAQPIVLTGKELGDFPDTPEGEKDFRAAAKVILMAMRKDPIFCDALSVDVDIVREGVNKITSMSADNRKLELVAGIRSLIKSAIFVKETKPYSSDEQDIVAYHIMRNNVILAGVDLQVRFVIKEKNDGHFQYDYTVHGEDSIFDSISTNEKALQLSKALTTNYKSGDQLESILLAGSRPDVLTHAQILSEFDSAVNNDEYILNMFIVGEDDKAVVEDKPLSVAELNQKAFDGVSGVLKAKYGWTDNQKSFSGLQPSGDINPDGNVIISVREGNGMIAASIGNGMDRETNIAIEMLPQNNQNAESYEKVAKTLNGRVEDYVLAKRAELQDQKPKPIIEPTPDAPKDESIIQDETVPTIEDAPIEPVVDPDTDYLNQVIDGTISVDDVDMDKIIAIGEKDETNQLFIDALAVIEKALDEATA
jgi:hypothetical protein